MAYSPTLKFWRTQSSGDSHIFFYPIYLFEIFYFKKQNPYSNLNHLISRFYVVTTLICLFEIDFKKRSSN